jgi:P-type conjugative transfer protein TrbJ
MRTSPNLIPAAALAAALTLPPHRTPAGAVSEVAGSTFPEQIVLTAVEQNEQVELQTEEQIGMFANQAENLGTLPMQFWGQLTGPVMQMQQIVSQAEGILAFVQNTPTQSVQQYGDGSGVVRYASGTLAKWTKRLNQQIQSTLTSRTTLSLARQ